MKTKSLNMTLEEAVGSAYSMIEDLANEVREVVDAAADTNFASSQRIQTLEETADTLENASEPTVPDELSKLEVTVGVMRGVRSRNDRRNEACSYIACVVDVLREREDDTAAEELADELEEAQNEWENVEFPGMYG